jgi:competence protein ComEC
LNRKRGNGFAARTWLENDGLLFDQKKNAALCKEPNVDRFIQAVGQERIFYLWGKKLDPFELDDLCREYDVLIVPQWDERIEGKCKFWGKKRLRYDGSLSFATGKDGLQIKTARQEGGKRLWNSYRLRKKRGI